MIEKIDVEDAIKLFGDAAEDARDEALLRQEISRLEIVNAKQAVVHATFCARRTFNKVKKSLAEEAKSNVFKAAQNAWLSIPKQRRF